MKTKVSALIDNLPHDDITWDILIQHIQLFQQLQAAAQHMPAYKLEGGITLMPEALQQLAELLQTE
jgi:hypothetical protein